MKSFGRITHAWRLVLVVAALLLTATQAAQAAPFAYIPNTTDNTVSVIDLADNIVTATVVVGAAPHGMAVNAAGTLVYITNNDGDSVSVLDTSNNTVVATIAVGAAPLGMAVSPAGNLAYAANSNSNTVSVIKTSNNTVIATVPVGIAPIGVAVNPAGTLVYTVNSGSNTVSVIDTSNNTVVATVPVGSFPFGIVVNPAGTLVYATNNKSNTVSVINTSNNAVVATVPVGAAPRGIAANPAGTLVYTANNDSNTVSVIDTSNNTVVATVAVGGGPYGIAVNPAGSLAYAANGNGDTVSVIGTSSNTVIGTVAVGRGPHAMGQFIGNTPASSAPQVDVRSYFPAASAARGSTSVLRVINTGSADTPVSVALIDGVTGTVGASQPLIASLAAGAATTLAAQQVEAALGVILAADARPRLRVTGALSLLDVQSMLQEAGGVLRDVTGSQNGASVVVSSYVPAAAGPAYVSALRVINTGKADSPVTVAVIDAASGATGTAGILNPSLAAGAAATYTAAQVESALGVSIAAADRPRLVVSAANSTLDVQSYLQQSGGALTEMWTGQSGTTVNVRSYVPASSAAYTTYLRVMNNSSRATPVTAAWIDETTGQSLAKGTILASLEANAASTLTSGRIEAALGVTIPAGSRPRIQISSPDGLAALRVQSFLLQPSGAFEEISNAVTGVMARVRSYYPAANAANGATSYLRVINTGTTSTALILSLIDPVTGALLDSVVLNQQFAAGAAQTFNSAEIEAAMGISLPAGARPRIQINGSTTLEVQSYLLQAGGTFTEVSGGQ